MNITNCISQVCNPVGVQRLRMCFTFSSLSSSVRIQQRMVRFAFPSYVSWRRQGVRKAIEQQSCGGLIPYFTLLHPPRVRLSSGITKARLSSPDVSWLLLACNLSKHTTGHQIVSAKEAAFCRSVFARYCFPCRIHSPFNTCWWQTEKACYRLSNSLIALKSTR